MPIIKCLVLLLLVLWLLLLFPIALILYQFSSGLSAQHVTHQINTANTYSFLDEELLPLIAKEIFQNWEQPWGMEIQETDFLQAARHAAPQQWIQLQVEDIVSQTMPFITGQENEFLINVSLDLPIQESLSILNQIGRQEARNVYREYFDRRIPDLFETWLATKEGLTFHEPLDGAQFSNNLQILFPADWFQDELEESLEELAPYFLGQTDGFLVTITFNDTKSLIVSSMIEDLLQNLNLQPIIIEKVVRPTVEATFADSKIPPCRNYDEQVQGVCFPIDNLNKVFEEIMTEDWLDARLALGYHEVAEYLVGEQDNFSIPISLKDFKPAILEVLFGPLSTKTIGTADEQLSLLQRATLKIDSVLLSVLIDEVFPEKIRITESIFKDFLDPKELEFIHEFREGFQGGWVYSDDDLRRTLAANHAALRVMDQLRVLGASGWQYSHHDLAVSLASAGNSPAVMESIDKFRRGIKLTTELRSLTIILLMIILLGIGLLAGQNGPHRLGWASGALTVAALFTYGLVGFINNVQLQSYLHDSFAGILVYEGSYSEIESVIFDQVFFESERIVKEFTSSVANRSLMVFLIASGILVTALIWSRILTSNTKFKP
jgi:hypothetical protein